MLYAANTTVQRLPHNLLQKLPIRSRRRCAAQRYGAANCWARVLLSEDDGAISCRAESHSRSSSQKRPLNALHFLRACWLAAPLTVAAADSWFTFIGDPVDPRADTLQILAASVVAIPGGRAVEIRASLSQENQTQTAGFAANLAADARPAPPYRSFTAELHIDCTLGTARVRRGVLFAGPLWTGAEQPMDYHEANMPTLVFAPKGRPDPVPRLVLAGCSFASGKTR